MLKEVKKYHPLKRKRKKNKIGRNESRTCGMYMKRVSSQKPSEEKN